MEERSEHPAIRAARLCPSSRRSGVREDLPDIHAKEEAAERVSTSDPGQHHTASSRRSRRAAVRRCRSLTLGTNMKPSVILLLALVMICSVSAAEFKDPTGIAELFGTEE